VLILYKDIATNTTTPMSCIDSYTIFPTQLTLNQTLKNFSLNVVSIMGNLQYYGIYYNSSLLTNVSNANGGSTNLQMNLTGYSGNLPIDYFFKCNGLNEYIQRVNYDVTATLPVNNGTFEQGMTDINNDGTTTFFWKILIVLISIVISLLIAWEIGLPPISYGIIVTVVLCMFTFYPIQWIPYVFTIVAGISLIGGSFYANQGGEMYG
jgi:hypothetical protein